MFIVSRRRRLVALLLVGCAGSSGAQTDYYNTDDRRPVRIEDAYAIERRGVELQAAPLRLERTTGGAYRWGLEPELAIGLLPRTQVELSLPFVVADGPSGRSASGLAGVGVSALHTLNVETTTLPALALRGDVLLPVGGFGPGRVYPSLTAIATRTYRLARVHANAQVTAGSARRASGAGELSRWLAGAAVDHTFPLRSLLVTGELYARRPFGMRDDGASAGSHQPVEWNAGVGTRVQLAPRWALDAGAGRRLTGDERGWYLTAGGALAFGLPWRS